MNEPRQFSEADVRRIAMNAMQSTVQECLAQMIAKRTPWVIDTQGMLDALMAAEMAR